MTFIFPYADFFTFLSLSTFFSYILPHGNFITSKIKTKEIFWVKENEYHSSNRQHRLCN